MKTFIQYLSEERKSADLKNTLYALFNIEPKTFDKAVAKVPSVLAYSTYGDDEIGAGVFDTEKIGKGIYQLKSRDNFGDIKYYKKVKMNRPIKTLVGTSFIDFLKSQGMVGSEKTIAPKEETK